MSNTTPKPFTGRSKAGPRMRTLEAHGPSEETVRSLRPWTPIHVYARRSAVAGHEGPAPGWYFNDGQGCTWGPYWTRITCVARINREREHQGLEFTPYKGYLPKTPAPTAQQSDTSPCEVDPQEIAQ